MPETKIKTCTKRKDVLRDCKVQIDLRVLRYVGESVEHYAARVNRAAQEFRAFCKDHRSIDHVLVVVVNVTDDLCSECGAVWETMEDDATKKTICASCGAEVQS